MTDMRDVRNTPMTDPVTPGGEAGEPYPIREPDQSLGDLAGRLTSDIGALVNDHMQLARTEIMAEVKQAGKGAGLLGGAGFAGWMAAVLLSFALAWGLAELMETWIAFLIVGVAWAIAAAVLGVSGKKEIDQADLTPNQTMTELEKDKQWIKEQTS